MKILVISIEDVEKSQAPTALMLMMIVVCHSRFLRLAKPFISQ